MKIAILGWGSLIWRPGSLETKQIDGVNSWLPDGPELPIEFARISQDGRLTLVIQDKATRIRTLYAISKYANLDEAILDLAVREGCGKSKIGHIQKAGGVYPDKFSHTETLRSWLHQNEDIDAVIWTNLSANFNDKLNLRLTAENVVNYLKHLPQDVQAKAEEYFRKAPAVVHTPIRNEVETALGWKPMSQ